ncbi:MAG: DNRLRE domain-containing protein [Planctomycetota bacterium]
MAHAAPAATVIFQNGLNGYGGTQDTWISERDRDQQRGNAASHEVEEDLNNWIFGNGPESQGLIRFDGLFGAALNEGDVIPTGWVPLNAIVTGATLTFEMTDDGLLTGSEIQGRRMTTAWSESSTWNSLGGGVNVGTETLSTNDFILAVADQGTGTKSRDVTAAVQDWHSGMNNLGWALVTTGEFGPAGDNGIQVAASENGTAANRPTLTVEFTPVFNDLDPIIDTLEVLGDVSVTDPFGFNTVASARGWTR